LKPFKLLFTTFELEREEVMASLEGGQAIEVEDELMYQGLFLFWVQFGADVWFKNNKSRVFFFCVWGREYEKHGFLVILKKKILVSPFFV
jgi:hypothetical protein